MNGPHPPYYTSEAQAASILVGRTIILNGAQPPAWDHSYKIHAVLLNDSGSPSEYYVPVGEDEAGLIFDWVDAEKYTVVS